MSPTRNGRANESARSAGIGRAARTRASVLAAGTEVLVERGVHGITVEEISRRTGLAKTTIYRYWPSKAELVVAIIDEQAFAFVDPDTGDPLQDLGLCLAAFSQTLAQPSHQVGLLGVLELAARDPEAAALHRDLAGGRAGPLLDIVARGVRSGRIPPELDARETLELLTGPILMRALVFGEAFDADGIDRLIRRVIGHQPRPPA